MLFLYLAAIPDFVLSLLSLLKDPVLIPLAVSLLTWLLNQYTTILKKVPNLLKDVLIVVVPAVVAQLGAFAGVPVSSVQAAAGGLVAVIIFKLGQHKEASK